MELIQREDEVAPTRALDDPWAAFWEHLAELFEREPESPQKPK
ncbi:hypothetical protein [Streptomyces sp. NPDC057257]